MSLLKAVCIFAILLLSGCLTDDINNIVELRTERQILVEEFCQNYFVNELTSYAGWYCPTENNTAKEFVCESGTCYYLDNSCPDLTCPDYQECPACSAKASCGAGKTFDACHLTDEYFKMQAEDLPYTGFSNIPSIFMGNKIVTVPVDSEEDLFVGCFYGFEHSGEEKLHRLIGIYSDYLVFRGDNNGANEKVYFKDVKYLVRSIKFE